MKNLIKTLVIFIVVLLLWSAIGVRKGDKNYFLSSATLDMARPLNVSIDVEFIKGLNPAYGKQ
jgi:hypothetical protein